MRQAALKAGQDGAPAYLHWFGWDSPVLDGRLPHSFHCSDMPFVFDATDRCDHMTGGAWVQFARTGNPSHVGLPPWPGFATDRRPTMILDDTCVVKDDPDGEELKAVAASMGWT